MASGDCVSGAAGGVTGEIVGLVTKARLANWLEERVEDARSGEVTTEQLLQELNEYQDAGVDVARLVSGFAVAVAGGDVDTAALTGGNAAENNALCAGICIGIIAAIAGYVTYLGDGDPLDGLAVFGSGDHPLSHAMAAAVSTTVEWSASKYPDETEAFLSILEVAGDAIDAKIEYLDDATGNKVSQHWNEIPEYTRNQIKGGVGIISIFVPGGSVKALKQLKAAKGRKYDTDWGFPCPSCFVAGTPIKIEGGYANIEDVKVGDFVLAKDVVTGRIEPKRVSQVHIRPTVDMNSFFALTVSNGLKSEVLRVTGEHPFWVKDEKQWVEVNDLKVGDTLIDHDGKAIDLIAKETIPEFEQTYNLTVEGFHTYFAGKLETLVHNCARAFEKSLANLPAGERVAAIKTKLGEVANKNGWPKDSRLSRLNGRDVYKDPKTGNLYAVDSQHGRFEMTNKRGRHIDEVNIEGVPQNKTYKDKSHDLKVK